MVFLHVLETGHQVLEGFGTVFAPDVPAGVHVLHSVGLVDVTDHRTVRRGDVGAVGASEKSIRLSKLVP